ncbi:MAG: hypothetical protein CBD38_03385 [bacterium TMED178]|nr:MAG: hypothetical protein CBD38_03385 [bacterium TMED178]
MILFMLQAMVHGEQFHDPFHGIHILKSQQGFSIHADHAPLSVIIDRVCWIHHKRCTIQSIKHFINVQLEHISWEEWVQWLEKEYAVSFSKSNNTFSPQKTAKEKTVFSYKPLYQNTQYLSDVIKKNSHYKQVDIALTPSELLIQSPHHAIPAIQKTLQEHDCQPKQITIKTDIITVDLDTLNELGIDPTITLSGKQLNQRYYQHFLTKIKNLELKGEAHFIAKPQIHLIAGQTALIDTLEHGQQEPLSLKLKVHAEAVGQHGLNLYIHLKHRFSEPKKGATDNTLETLVYAQHQDHLILGGLREIVTFSRSSCLLGMRDLPLLNRIFCLSEDYKKNQVLLILMTPELKQQCKA